METQRNFYKTILEDLDEAKAELFASLKSQLRDIRKLPGRLPESEWDRLKKVYTEQMTRITVMENAARGRMKYENYLLKDARIEHGLTQAELAKKVGVSRQWIVYLETGERQSARQKVSKSVKLRVCEILGISFEEAFPIDQLLEVLDKKVKL